MKPQKNPILEIFINVLIPVILLNYLSKAIDPRIALVVALSVPLGYGVYTYIKSKHKNIFSIFGFVNILLTGGLALVTFEGMWFVVKETALPLLLGVVVLLTRFMKRTAFSWMFWNEYIFNTEFLEEKLEEKNNKLKFQKHLKVCNDLFGLSFFVSAILNFLLARNVFKALPEGLDNLKKQELLNEQIADMTWKSQIVIVVPLMVIGMLTLGYFIMKMLKHTGLEVKDIQKVVAKKI